ncbi:unnamed protein product [Brassica oleracea]
MYFLKKSDPYLLKNRGQRIGNGLGRRGRSLLSKPALRVKEGRKGVVSMDAEIFQVTPTFHMVEVKKCNGDSVGLAE